MKNTEAFLSVSYINNQEFSEELSNTMSPGGFKSSHATGSESTSKIESGRIQEGAKVRWTKIQERELLNIIMDSWPRNPPQSQLEIFADKYKRTILSIRSKVQKIRKRYQRSMENELDQMFSHENSGRRDSRERTKTEKKRIIQKVLKKKAIDGMCFNDLRKQIPEALLTASDLTHTLRNLEDEGSITRKSEFVVKLSDCKIKDPIIAVYLNSLNLKEDFLKGYHRITRLFPDSLDPGLRQKFISDQYDVIKEVQVIYWLD